MRKYKISGRFIFLIFSNFTVDSKILKLHESFIINICSKIFVPRCITRMFSSRSNLIKRLLHHDEIDNNIEKKIFDTILIGLAALVSSFQFVCR